jgi:hypothetical protein
VQPAGAGVRAARGGGVPKHSALRAAVEHAAGADLRLRFRPMFEGVMAYADGCPFASLSDADPGWADQSARFARAAKPGVPAASAPRGDDRRAGALQLRQVALRRPCGPAGACRRRGPRGSRGPARRAPRAAAAARRSLRRSSRGAGRARRRRGRSARPRRARSRRSARPPPGAGRAARRRRASRRRAARSRSASRAPSRRRSLPGAAAGPPSRAPAAHRSRSRPSRRRGAGSPASTRRRSARSCRRARPGRR